MDESIYKEPHPCWFEFKHGMGKTPEYRSWSMMKSRCYNRNNRKYSRYGGRGIVVCDRWLNSFENFYKDMGPKPFGFSIERKDNDGHYCPENCEWADSYTQSNNKKDNVLLTFREQTKTLGQWARELGIKYKTLHNRIFALGWDVEKALVDKDHRYNDG